MQTIPTLTSTTLTDLRPRIRALPFVPGDTVVIKSSVTDSGSTPTSRIRPGNVLVKKTSDGLFYLSNDGSNGDRNAPGAVSSATGITTSWENTTFTFTLEGGVSFTVAMATAQNSNATVVTALNANAVFAANFIADVNASAVRIRSLRGGSTVSFTVSSTYGSAFGASVASLDAVGTDAMYVVLEDYVDLLDQNGSAQNNSGPCSLVGYYDTSKFLNASAEAKAVLCRRGSILK